MKVSIIQHPLTLLWHWATIQSDGQWWISSEGRSTQEQAREVAIRIYNHVPVN